MDVSTRNFGHFIFWVSTKWHETWPAWCPWCLEPTCMVWCWVWCMFTCPCQNQSLVAQAILSFLSCFWASKSDETWWVYCPMHLEPVWPYAKTSNWSYCQKLIPGNFGHFQCLLDLQMAWNFISLMSTALMSTACRTWSYVWFAKFPFFLLCGGGDFGGSLLSGCRFLVQVLMFVVDHVCYLYLCLNLAYFLQTECYPPKSFGLACTRNFGLFGPF